MCDLEYIKQTKNRTNFRRKADTNFKRKKGHKLSSENIYMLNFILYAKFLDIISRIKITTVLTLIYNTENYWNTNLYIVN